MASPTVLGFPAIHLPGRRQPVWRGENKRPFAFEVPEPEKLLKTISSESLQGKCLVRRLTSALSHPKRRRSPFFISAQISRGLPPCGDLTGSSHWRSNGLRRTPDIARDHRAVAQHHEVLGLGVDIGNVELGEQLGELADEPRAVVHDDLVARVVRPGQLRSGVDERAAGKPRRAATRQRPGRPPAPTAECAASSPRPWGWRRTRRPVVVR